ncbi:MAG: T9SS type A sorting domain-containing protein [Ignavibacteriae bacterium]|nr:T9SS type A sorting domain-containing protein [Ignavibacteriota bacterium]
MTRMLRWCCPLIISMFVGTASDAQPSLTLKTILRSALHRPTRVAARSSGMIAVGDYHRKQICFFDGSGRLLSLIPVPTSPLSVAFAGDGNLYVGIAHDVLRMTIQGEIIDRFSLHGAVLGIPVDIAVGASGNVSILDKETHRVNVFSSVGDLQFWFGTPGTANGQFRLPSGLALDRAAGEIIVADAGNSRIQIFSLQGQFRRAFGQHVQLIDTTWRIIGAFAQMQGVAVDADHRIYVSDSGLNHVQIFDSQGNFLRFLGREGHPSTNFRVPMGIATADSILYVASMAGSEVQAYTVNGLITSVSEPTAPMTYSLEQNYPNPFNPTTSIRFSLPSGGLVNLTIYDIAGREVKTLVNEQRLAGIHTVAWDGRGKAGMSVSSGVYFYRLTVGNEFTQTNKMAFIR